MSTVSHNFTFINKKAIMCGALITKSNDEC